MLFVQSRGVRLSSGGEDGPDALNMELTGPHPAGARVHLSPDGVLVWPVMLLYPEYGQSDYIEAFKETDRFTAYITLYTTCVYRQSVLSVRQTRCYHPV